MAKVFTISHYLTAVCRDIILSVVDSIPEGWAVLRGRLYAPEVMLFNKEALSSTKLVFGTLIDQTIDKIGENDTADVVGILVKGKQPGRVDFGRGFEPCKVMPMSQSKLVVAHYIRLGYYGHLTFAWRDPEDREPVDFGCHIVLPSINSDIPITFRIESNDQDRPESGATVTPILEVCKALKLQGVAFQEKWSGAL